MRNGRKELMEKVSNCCLTNGYVANNSRAKVFIKTGVCHSERSEESKRTILIMSLVAYRILGTKKLNILTVQQ